MLSGMLESSTIPILEQVVRFTQARHTVLAGNLANLHTPGYEARDLPVEEFQAQLAQAIQLRQQQRGAPSPGDLATSGKDMAFEASRRPRSIRAAVGENAVERQVTEMVKNQLQHNLALAILASQFRLLQAAVSERV